MNYLLLISLFVIGLIGVYIYNVINESVLSIIKNIDKYEVSLINNRHTNFLVIKNKGKSISFYPYDNYLLARNEGTKETIEFLDKIMKGYELIGNG